jgi:hypothetical protein
MHFTLTVRQQLHFSGFHTSANTFQTGLMHAAETISSECVIDDACGLTQCMAALRQQAQRAQLTVYGSPAPSYTT